MFSVVTVRGNLSLLWAISQLRVLFDAGIYLAVGAWRFQAPHSSSRKAETQ